MRIKDNPECRIVFLSCATHQRKKLFADPKKAKLLRQLFQDGEDRYQYSIHHYCIMPDHYHFLIELQGSNNLSDILHRIHSYYVQCLFRGKKKEKVFRRAWDVWIRSEWMYWQKVAYILLNPYYAGLVKSPFDPYPLSSLEQLRQVRGQEFLDDLFREYGRRWGR